MKDKKHIDRLFQEKLKNFEATPDDAVWDKIDAKLRKDKGDDRKVIPFWWRFAGIAAGLILLISIGYAVLNRPIEGNTPTEVVDTEAQEKTNNTDQKNNDVNNKAEDVINNNIISEDQVTSSENDAVKEGETEDDTYEKASDATATQQQSKVAATQTEKQLNNKLKNNAPYLSGNKDNPTIVEANNPQENQKNESAIAKKESSNAVANNTPQNLPNQQTSIEQNPEAHVLDNSKEGIAETNPNIKEQEKEQIKEITEELKPSIEDALTLSEDVEDINEKEKEVKNRWSVTPNVAPVYFNTLGEGSSIHSQFKNNSKSGDLNIGFGIDASYAVTDKLSVRSGIHKINVGYTTNDVLVFQSIGVSSFNRNNALPNVDLASGSQDISVISAEALSEAPNIVVEASKTTISQEMSFVEIPVEIAYKVSDKKLDISIIGGVSAMILDDNNLYTELNNEKTLLGEATNINSLSYSANIGIGLDYEVSERMSLNVEPTFKYQVNTFNNTSGNFAPYIVGVNSGVKFKF